MFPAWPLARLWRVIGARARPDPDQEFRRGTALPPCRHHVLRPVHRRRRATSSTAPSLLAEMLGEGNDREGIAQRMRDAEHAADETTHDIVRRVNTTFVTPFDREDIYSLASGLDDVMDFMEEAVDLTLLYEVERAPQGAGQPGRGDPALRRAHRQLDAAAAHHAGPRGVLDRDQPAGEPRRQELPPDPRQAVQRQVRSARGAQAQGRRRLARGGHRRVRDGREHRRADRRQESPRGRWSSRSSSRSSSSPWSSTTPTASTTPPTRSPPRCRPGR